MADEPGGTCHSHILFTAAPIDMASHGSLGIKDPHCALTGPSVSGVPF